MSTVRGSCLCGDVAWETTTPLEFMSHCHCGRCRKAHGTAFATMAMTPTSGFRLVRGDDRIVRYASSAGFTRPFCGRCGSVVASGDEFQGLVAVPVGSLDDDPGTRPLCHIFVASKAPWYMIPNDGLPRFDAYPPSVDADILPDPPLAPRGDGPVRGSCLCGGVAFVMTGTPIRANYCHCGRCRKARAAAHGTNVFTRMDGVRFTRGEDRVTSYNVPGARFFRHVFCSTCGSSMPRLDPERDYAVIPLGSLDDVPAMPPPNHIFVDSKASWFEIADDLPRYPEGPPRT
jgi:hypothetical protein